jgi:hypothetical protein
MNEGIKDPPDPLVLVIEEETSSVKSYWSSLIWCFNLAKGTSHPCTYCPSEKLFTLTPEDIYTFLATKAYSWWNENKEIQRKKLILVKMYITCTYFTSPNTSKKLSNCQLDLIFILVTRPFTNSTFLSFNPNFWINLHIKIHCIMMCIKNLHYLLN